MKPYTIEDLHAMCEMQIKKGNGNKYIMISSDDEGNSYHYLWYGFTSGIMAEDFIDEEVAKEEDTIVLG